MRIFIVSLALIFLVGCTHYSDPTIVAANKATLAGTGENVGTLPDGRKIIRYQIDMGMEQDHWVYVTEGSITINRSERHGKTSYNHVDVIIDGIQYRPVLEEQNGK